VGGSAFEGSRPDTYQQVGVMLGLLNFDSLIHRFIKITREPQAPIGIDWLASRPR